MNTTTKVLAGFLVGVAAGAAAGLLLAPQNGSVTRRRLSKESERLIDSLTANVKDTVDDTINAIRNTYNDHAKDLANDLGKTVRSKAREVRGVLN